MTCSGLLCTAPGMNFGSPRSMAALARAGVAAAAVLNLEGAFAEDLGSRLLEQLVGAIGMTAPTWRVDG